MEDRFLSNYGQEKFLDYIKDSINNCKSFCFSVSFIKKAGLILLEKEIVNALERGVIGKIITSTYQNFTDIASLETFFEWMVKYPNFSCHLDFNCFGENGFHSKGYIFEFDDKNELVIGSTNITRFALLKNIEWNVSITDRSKFNSYFQGIKEFLDLWNNTLELSKDLINKYKIQLDYAIEKWDMDYVDVVNNQIKPNSMQRKALKELRRNRDMGVNKALVISATGSGKTYLCAFDALNYDAKRVLFVCHRDKILFDARETFKKVFGTSRTYGLYVGNNKEIDCDFIFASNVMLSTHLTEFDPREFDYICIDEAHHSTATTYKNIIEYFKPGFLLGITATADRMDNENVYELFDRNVPYQLNLRDAIINDLVVPFHYYGIRDKLIDYKSKDRDVITREIAKNSNIDFICKEIESHRPEDKLKAIAFCTSLAHCSLMAESFNEMGYSAISLTGKNDLGQRIKAFNDLQDDNNKLEIICTVDILNEGVDIPRVNMVLFLRPTESQIVFLQQLGRGLRKCEGKEYVTVLDFIGNNYQRSVQIAMGLGTLGKSSIIEKPYLMDLVRTDFSTLDIPGVIINIDQLSKEEIIDNLKNQNFNTIDFLTQDYKNFKEYLHCETYPSHMDYLNSDCSPNLLRFIKSTMRGGKNKSYYTFMKKIGEESLPIFDDDEITLVDTIEELLPLVRPDEFLIIRELLFKDDLDLECLVNYTSRTTSDTLNNALYLLKKEKIVSEDNKLNISKTRNDFTEYVKDTLEYGLTRYDIEFGDFNTKFKKYGNYYKEQIMRSLCQPNLMFMKGTKFDENGETYLFVGLNKDKSKQERMNYKDRFLSSKIFQWESENNTKWDNNIGQKLRNTKIVHLFVRKMDSEDGITLPFTYFGTGSFTNARESFVTVYNKNGSTNNVPTLLFDVLLDSEVDKEFFFDFEIPDKEMN
ncbi:MAG: DUF3427 domain-containing protein [Bacilli bacterium]